MGELHLTTLRLNPQHPQAAAEWRDICRMKARISDATVGMPDGPRILWAQPAPWMLVVRATEPITAARLPAQWGEVLSHRRWHPPAAGRHRAVLMWNPVKQHTVRADGSRRTRRRPIAERQQQIEWLTSLFAPMVQRLSLHIDDEWTARGWHRDGHRITHRLATVRLACEVVDPDALGEIVTRGFGRARAYGGGLSIWEKT